MVALRVSDHPAMTDLEQRRRQLEALLVDGWRRIDAAILDGHDVVEWEQRWLRLLGEYEHVCALQRGL